jgi:hypothetical protein
MGKVSRGAFKPGLENDSRISEVFNALEILIISNDGLP